MICLLLGHDRRVVMGGIYIDVGRPDEQRIGIVKCDRCGELDILNVYDPPRRIPRRPPDEKAPTT